MSIFAYKIIVAKFMRYTIEDKDGYRLVTTDDGMQIGYSPESGLAIIEIDGLPFKDFTGTGQLLPYEDWRLPAEQRAADLAARLSIEEIAGLMLYSPQNWLPMPNDTYGETLPLSVFEK
ncbi:MAG: hypothetical protein ACI4A8_04430, partial [Muribaculaceae bacterium]